MLIFLNVATTITGLSTTPGDWFMINPKQQAFYRVNYDQVLRQEIVLQLNVNPSVRKPSSHDYSESVTPTDSVTQRHGQTSSGWRRRERSSHWDFVS